MFEQPLKNVLFDLGGVLYQIDFPATVASLEKIPSSAPFEGIKALKHPAFSQMEAGHMNMDTVASTIIQEYGLKVNVSEITEIWKNLLVGVYAGRVEIIDRLANQFSLGLLSNTSRFHYEHYISECQPMFEKMQHLFFSFDMGLNKPAKEIYEQVLIQTGWRAEETLFLDDSPANIAGAASLGIQTVLIDQPDRVKEVAEALLGG